MLILNNISKTYRPKKGTHVDALKDISLKLPNKGLVFILGKSGSGKSTLLNVLGGLDSFDKGSITFNGTPIDNFKEQDFDSYRNTYIGFIFQEYNILDEFNVAQNIALSIELQNKKPTNEEIENILKLVDLQGLADRKPNELSGGQRQRVAIARSLIKNPHIILADEPTGNLDSETGKQILDTLKKLSENKLVVVVSHDREFALKYGDRIIELSDGEIIKDTTRITTINEQIDNLSFNSDSINVKYDYDLTDEDLIKIKDFINNKDNEVVIKKIKQEMSYEFVETTDDSIETSNDGFRLIKSKLPIKDAIKIGANSLKHKKFRLVMTIILSVVAFTLFAFSDTCASFKRGRSEVESIIDNKINYAAMTYLKQRDKDWYGMEKITYNNLDELKEQFGLDFKIVLNDYIYYSFNTYPNMYPSTAAGIAHYSQEELDAIDFKVIGNLPVNDNELCITKFIADWYLKYGFVYNSNPETITSINDLIGKKLSCGWGEEAKDFIITGIVDTNDDSKKYSDAVDADYEKLTNAEIVYYAILNIEFANIIKYAYCNIIFVSESYYNSKFSEEDTYNYAIAPMPKDKATIKAMVNETNSDKETKYYLNNKVTYEMDLVYSMLSALKKVFMVLGIIFAVFAMVLFSTFIASSISYKRRQIGILRAIGSKKSDIFKIFFSEALIISTIVFVITVLITVIICIRSNIAFRTTGIELTLFNFGIRQILLLVVLAVGSSAIATLLPSRRFAKQKPIDAIREK